MKCKMLSKEVLELFKHENNNDKEELSKSESCIGKLNNVRETKLQLKSNLQKELENVFKTIENLDESITTRNINNGILSNKIKIRANLTSI
jgi:hypothetical protein